MSETILICSWSCRAGVFWELVADESGLCATGSVTNGLLWDRWRALGCLFLLGEMRVSQALHFRTVGADNFVFPYIMLLI